MSSSSSPPPDPEAVSSPDLPPLAAPIAVAAAVTAATASSGGGGGSGRRLPPPCWTHEETLALIEAYCDRWEALRKGNLRAADWDDVAGAVTARCGRFPTATHNSGVQCRHKVEKLWKRYRAERARSAGRSKGPKWPFFQLLHDLAGLHFEIWGGLMLLVLAEFGSDCGVYLLILVFQATRVYCFVHQVPVCGECICFPEHQLCVVKNYAEWVVNSDYDWPQHCSSCNSVLEAGSEETTRLGCLHVMHTKCLISHIQSFPTQTAPAGYVCPSCSTPIWPPSSIKDTGSCLHSKLKEAIVQTGLEKNVFGNHYVAMPKVDTLTPPAFASDPLKHLSSSGESNGANTINYAKDATSTSTLLSKEDKYPTGMYSSGTPSHVEPEIVEIDGPRPITTQFPEQESNFIRSPSPQGPGAMTRKGANYVERQNSEISYYADDEDGNRKKYTKRGTFRHKFLRMLLPFWSSALPTLPVTAPPKKENDAPEGHSRHQRSRMDPTKILLAMAIMACIATMGILYYRLSQRSLSDSENFIEDEP